MMGIEAYIGEIIAFLTVFATMVGAYYKLSGSLEAVRERNNKADTAHELLDKRMTSEIRMLDARIDGLETSVKRDIIQSQSFVETKITGLEQRLRGIDIFTARMDEKLLNLQEQNKRIIDILEKDKK